MKSFAGCAVLAVAATAADSEGMNLMELMQQGEKMLGGMAVSQSITGEDGETKTLSKSFSFPAMAGKNGSGLKIKKLAFPEGMRGPSPMSMSFGHTFPEGMQGASPMSMSFGHSFTLGNGESKSVSFSPMSMPGLKVKKSLTEIKDPVIVYNTMGNECGQVTVDKSQEQMAMKMMLGGKVGTCASAGYTIADGKEVAPFMGGVTVLTFKKSADGKAPDMKEAMKQMQPQINEMMKMLGPQMQELAKAMQHTDGAQDSVTLYKIAGSECGQATIDEKFEKAAVSFMHMKEGTCTSQGFSTPDGSKTMNVPVLGSITIAKFKKSKKLLLKKDSVVV